ncbi:MAG: hypothetical protein WCJ19_00880 [bacterium]
MYPNQTNTQGPTVVAPIQQMPQGGPVIYSPNQMVGTKKSPWKWILFGCLGCFGISVIGFILIFVFAIKTVADMNKNTVSLVENTCTQVNDDGNIQKYLSKDLLADSSTTTSTLATLVYTMTGCKAFDGTTTAYDNINGREVIKSSGKLLYKDGTSKTIDIDSIKESGEWKILYIYIR